MTNDTFKILIATDIHMGYCERDPVRGMDSINTFEEILQIATDQKVDFLLLGGDLFHENKPSRAVRYHCMNLLRRYCMNDRPIGFELISDPSVNFQHSAGFPVANFEDPNINIGLPVFSINGNHDDISGNPSLCELDILHSTGLINLFGKYSTALQDRINISPVLLQKGTTKLALFGLGAIRDERLHRMFKSKHISFLRPGDDTEEWFNLFCIHQNRVKHGETNYIPEHFLPSFLDLVLWGHEHPCRIDPEHVPEPFNFFITQPGSSVATALSEGESCDKFVGLVHVKGRNFKINPIKLETIRPFVFGDLALMDNDVKPNDPNVDKKVQRLISDKLEEMVSDADSTRGVKQPKLPLLRLRVDYSHGFVIPGIQDLLLFHRRREQPQLRSNLNLGTLNESMAMDREDIGLSNVEDLVKKYFDNVNADDQMLMLTESGLGEGIKHFVDKQDREAISLVVRNQMKKSEKRIIKDKDVVKTEDSVVEYLKLVREKRYKLNQSRNCLSKEDQELREELTKNYASKAPNKADEDGVKSDSDGSDAGQSVATKSNGTSRKRATTARGRGSRGRGARGSKAAAAGSQRSLLDFNTTVKSPVVSIVDNDYESDSDMFSNKNSRKRPRGSSQNSEMKPIRHSARSQHSKISQPTGNKTNSGVTSSDDDF